jgi:hypothetical protein
MKGSKITLFAAQTSQQGVWRPMPEPGFVVAYTKEQQRQNRENNKTNRGNARRDERTHLLCEVGGGWFKYFPTCKKINPRNPAQVAVVVRFFAILAKNPWVMRLWGEVEQEIDNEASGGKLSSGDSA